MNARTLVVATLAMGLSACITGCSSSGYSRTDTALESMESTGARLDRGAKQVDAVVSSLESVVAATPDDLRSAYKAFSSEVDRTESAANGARDRANDMKAHAKEHFDQWMLEAQGITDKQLREASMARRDKAMQAYGRAVEAMQKAKAAYDPFMAQLKDIRSYLGIDLSTQGVKSASPTIALARASGKNLRDAIASAEQALGAVRTELRAAATSQ